MKLKFLLFALSFVALLQQAHSQNVGISTNGATPDPSAMLDIVSSNKGLLIPRISLSSTADAAISPATSLLVYNTNAAMTNGNGAGFYYNSGTSGAPSWVKLVTSNGKPWETAGNTGTTAGTDFIGTTDGQALVFKTNNTEKMRITSTGSVGINNNAPAQPLDVTGNVQFSGALMPGAAAGTSGQVLTSAGAGAVPTWGALGQSSTTYFNTGALSLTSGTGLTYATGFPVNITVPNNCKTIVTIDIGIQFTTNTTSNTYCDVALIVDGFTTNDGAYYRKGGSSSSLNVLAWATINITQTLNLSAGAHTLGVAAGRGGGSVVFGGDGTSVLQGEMTVTFIKN
jgi:hypothetical protein